MRESATDYILRRLKENECALVNPQISEEPFLNILKMMRAWNDECEVHYRDDGLLIESDYNYEGKERKGFVLIKEKREPGEYTYYSHSSCLCDGTMVFWFDLANDMVKKLLCFGTYYMPMFDPATMRTEDYTLVYEIDNAVRITEYGEELAPEDKKWMCGRFGLFLPIRFSVEKRLKA